MAFSPRHEGDTPFRDWPQEAGQFGVEIERIGFGKSKGFYDPQCVRHCQYWNLDALNLDGAFCLLQLPTIRKKAFEDNKLN